MELCFKPPRVTCLMSGANVRSFGWVVLALFLMAVPGNTETVCQDIFPEAFGNPAKPGLCYASDSYQRRNFEGALSFCRSLPIGSWSVVDIEDADENLFLKVWNRDNFPKKDGYWIGQNDREEEGVYQYTSSGQRPVYLNWRDDQPNDDGNQDCVVMFESDGGRFQDKDCGENYFTLCRLKNVCQDIFPGAFGNLAKPGVCYASDSHHGRSFEDALSFCRSLPNGSWSVADIEDADENLFLDLWNTNSFPDNNGYWIGQNDREQEGVYQYTSSVQNPVYLSWRHDQPNDDGKQDCVAMFKSDDGRFQDKDCGESYFTLCKLKNVCQDIFPEAFGNFAKPGVCYASDSHHGRNFEGALSFCRSLPNGSWSVADIEDADENLFLDLWNTNSFPNNDGYWIGQNDREKEGVYQYTSSVQRPVYLNWRDGQPNDDGNQDCVVMFESDDGRFQDKDCGENYFTLCKLIKEPTTKDSCSYKISPSRPRKFVFLSADATCRPEDVLTPSYHVKTNVQCARDCSMESACRSFGFLTSGNEDNCVLCNKILQIKDIVIKDGSLIYTEAP